MAQHHRIGLIVPSSNTTMETEVPERLRRQAAASAHRFTTHGARLRLKQVTPEALAAMNEQAGDAVDALADAECDALMYACLVPAAAAASRPPSATWRRARRLWSALRARWRPPCSPSARSAWRWSRRHAPGPARRRRAPIFGYERERVSIWRDGPHLEYFKQQIPWPLRGWEHEARLVVAA